MSADLEIPRGLPAPLPAGERILWQGAPRASALAWRAFHVRDVLLWFALVAVARVVAEIADGVRVTEALSQQAKLVPFCLAAVALLGTLAWLSARTSVYTITDQRIIMRVGIALPLTVNLPHEKIATAFLRRGANDVGDIGIVFADDTRLAWLVLWPHCRPWHVRKPEPLLRAIPDVAAVADLLSATLAASAGAGQSTRTAANAADVRIAPLPAGVGAAT